MDAKVFVLVGRILGENIGVSSFRNRLIVQKMVYLLKSAGLAPNYFFTWYIRGPYSVALSSDAFAFYKNIPKQETTLTSSEELLVQKMRSFLSEELNDFDELESKLELFASLLFLRDERKMTLSDPQLVSLLKTLKPWFTEEQIKNAVGKIIDSRLFN